MSRPVAAVIFGLCVLALGAAAGPRADVAADLFAAAEATVVPCDERFGAGLRSTVKVDCATSQPGLKAFRADWDRAMARVRSTGREVAPLASHWIRWDKRWRGRYHRVDGMPLLTLFDGASGDIVVARYELRQPCRERARQTAVQFARDEQREEGDRAPRVTRRIDPVFPERGRLGRQAGVVLLWYVVDAAGAVGSPCLVAAAPHGYGFVEAATDAVERWSYEPGTLDGQPVPMEVLTELSFQQAAMPLPHADLLRPFFVEP